MKKDPAISNPGKKPWFAFPGLPFAKSKKGSKILAGEEYLCLNLQEQEAKLAVLSAKLPGSRQLEQFYDISAQGLSPDELSDRIFTTVQAMRLTHPKFIGVISSNFAVTRNIEIPSLDPDEIREILSLQATRHTPYARDEIIIDYLNLGTFKSVYTKVLFIIVPRSVVMRYYNLASRLHIPIEKIVFVSEAIAWCYWKQLNLLNERAPVCLVHIDSTTSEFVIMFRGASLFTRSIPVGAKHFSVAKEGYQARFIEELKKSVETYQSENIDIMPAKFFLGGATQGLEDLELAIEDIFHMPIKRVSDLEVLTIQPALKTKCIDQNIAFLPVAAAGAVSEDLRVDLSPEESKMKRSLEERSKQLIKTGILVMVLLGMLSLSIACHIYMKSARLQQLVQRYEPIRRETESLERIYSKVRAVKSHLALRGKALEALTDIFALLPKDLYLTDVKYDADGRMSIKGSAYAKQSIFALVDKLGSSPIFKNVQTRYITGRVEKGTEVSDFEITLSLD